MKIVGAGRAGSIGSNVAEHLLTKPFDLPCIADFFIGKLLALVKCKKIMVFTRGIFDKIILHSSFKTELFY